jgi:hypothetical protein
VMSAVVSLFWLNFQSPAVAPGARYRVAAE